MDALLHEEMTSRRSKALAAAHAADAPAVVVYSGDGRGATLRYLTNFAPIFGDAALVLTAARATFAMNFGWELPRAEEESGLTDLVATFDMPGVVTRVLLEAGVAGGRVATVGFDRIPYPMFVELQRAHPGVEFVSITPVVEHARRIKTAYEIAQLRRAVEITDAALAAVRAAIRPGVAESELAAIADYAMKSQGVNELAFPTCVVSGMHDLMPIRLPTTRQLQRGDTVMVDIGANWAGYNADLSRTFVVGRPNADQARIWEMLTEAWRSVQDAAQLGRPTQDLQRAAAEVYRAYGHTLKHRVGHGIGLHTSLEWPSVDVEESPLVPGMTFSFEPGFCMDGFGNYKLEDDIVMTQQGPELISHADRALAVEP